jgi:5-methylcytosine-specific restriction protein A
VPKNVRGKAVTTSERGYGWRWQKASATFLANYPLCGDRPNAAPVMSRCHAEGRAVQAQQVDHVVPHKGDQTLFWDTKGNWQSLCSSCGTRKSRAGL